MDLIHEVCLSAVRKMAWPAGLKQQTCTSHSSGGWKPKIQAPADSMSGEDLPPGSWLSSCHDLTWGKEQERALHGNEYGCILSSDLHFYEHIYLNFYIVFLQDLKGNNLKMAFNMLGAAMEDLRWT